MSHSRCVLWSARDQTKGKMEMQRIGEKKFPTSSLGSPRTSLPSGDPSPPPPVPYPRCGRGGDGPERGIAGRGGAGHGGFEVGKRALKRRQTKTKWHLYTVYVRVRTREGRKKKKENKKSCGENENISAQEI